MPKITKRIVDQTSPNPDDRVFVWDSEIRGFGLVVHPSGAKSFIYQYRAAGISRRPTLGDYGSTTAEQARRLALDMAERVRRGEDPLRDKQAARDALTVAGLLDLYAQSESFKANAVITQSLDLGRIRRHLVPLLGRFRADKLTSHDVERCLRSIREGATAVREKSSNLRGLARVTGGPTAAINCAVLLRTAFNWAIKQKLVKENPVTGVKIGTPGIRDTVLDSDDYRRMFEALARLETNGRIQPAACAALAVIALTGARRGEITGLRWRHVDIKTGQIVLQAHEHKSGRKTNRRRTIGLPAMAQTIIAKQPPGDENDLVFRPTHGDRPIHLTRPWQRVRAEAQLPASAVIHSLRHSVASHSAMAGMSTVEMMASLGHASTQHLVRYVHYAENSRQALAEKAASVAIAALQAATGAESAEIVPIKGR